MSRYWNAHSRFKKDPARNHLCVDCGKQARDMAYDHLDPEDIFETVRVKRKPMPLVWSPDDRHYQPKCRKCHSIGDKEYRQIQEILFLA